MASEVNKQDENKDESLFNLRWMIRPCETYKDEYSDCRSIKARFNQYFIHGESIDCNAWKTDHDNCIRWTEDNNINALKELISSEENRREQRLLPHYKNDIWKKRVGPPPEWNKPLPAWLEEENKATYLGIKADEIRNHGSPIEGERSLCVIS